MLVLGIAVLVLAMCVSSDSHNSGSNNSSRVWLSCPTLFEGYSGGSTIEGTMCRYRYNVPQGEVDRFLDGTRGGNIQQNSIKATCDDGQCVVTFKALATER
jgi:hypothetical protein